MLEFITMLSVMALVFCVATVLVAWISSAVLRIARAVRRRTREDLS